MIIAIKKFSRWGRHVPPPKKSCCPSPTPMIMDNTHSSTIQTALPSSVTLLTDPCWISVTALILLWHFTDCLLFSLINAAYIYRLSHGCFHIGPYIKPERQAGREPQRGPRNHSRGALVFNPHSLGAGIETEEALKGGG